jgi:hypothetical protein
MLWLAIPINVIIVAFGVMVAALMALIIRWNNLNHNQNPNLHQQIGDSGHGRSL